MASVIGRSCGFKVNEGFSPAWGRFVYGMLIDLRPACETTESGRRLGAMDLNQIPLIGMLVRRMDFLAARQRVIAQ
ncbi:MAG: hypothetical protein PHS60_11770, partial [Zavarzinia sp.]|nr:hypothetical protein [Zavarzinia sp.]